MRALPSVYRQLALWCLMLSAGLALACEQLPAGDTIRVRLTAPISTYNAKVGDPVHAVVTEDVMCGDETIFPVGSSVAGSVLSVRKVGLGFRHETAALQIGFHGITAMPNQEVPIDAALAGIDNAREQVSNGKIHGIRSTYTPQGRITSRLKYLPTWNPYPDIGLLVFKATFPIFPEPEIYLPTATDLQLRLTGPVTHPAVAAMHDAGDEAGLDRTQMNALVAELPQRTTTATLASADLVNLVFIGTREQVQAAFTNAGWQTADAFNKHSFLLNFYAFLNNSGYAHAPMRPFLLEGESASMSWEKSLNSYARRDHLRVWQWPQSPAGETVWVSSSTHDVNARLSLKYREFVHHIDPAVDEERSKVIRDLNAAGCVKSVYLAPRRQVPNLTQNATGDMVKTDGAIAVVQMQNCHAAVPELASTPTTVPYKPGNLVFRYMRRSVLTVRSDIWRANIIYGAYDLTRMSVQAWKHHEMMSAGMLGAKKAGPAVEAGGLVGAVSAIE